MRRDLGIVVIGRNEGERLRRCLVSLGELVAATVYVDSGSTDGSVAMARAAGAEVVELDLSITFTAARARNAGFARLRAVLPEVELVQFVDGDCELEAGWLQVARDALAQDEGVVAVFGRRREREREASPYNRMSDLEWDVPVGEVLSCGGDVMMRVLELAAVGGYDETLIAGEEPELCQRLRAHGWRIRRVDAPMTIHDAAMRRFGQWWRRAVRAGYVEGEGMVRSGRGYPRWRQAMSHLFWVFGVPLVMFTGAVAAVWCGAPPMLAGAGFLIATGAAYALLWLRIRRHAARRWPPRDAACFATFCLLAKWPAVQGMGTYLWRRLRGGPRRLIEYKDVGTPAS